MGLRRKHPEKQLFGTMVRDLTIPLVLLALVAACFVRLGRLAPDHPGPSRLVDYVFPVVEVLAVGLLGRERRIGSWGALILSVILTPIGGLLVTLLSGPRPPSPDAEATRHHEARPNV